MARAKKQKENEEQKGSSTQENSSIAYSGKVTIQFVRNNRTVRTIRKHNSGCEALFEFLSKCLSGNYEYSGVPMYLAGFRVNGEIWTRALASPVPLTNVVTERKLDDGTYVGHKTTYKFIIPSTSIYSVPLNVFALYSTENVSNYNKNNASAIIQLEQEITSEDVGKGISIIVVWEITIENKTIGG